MAPVSISVEFVLFCVMPVTFEPMPALMSVLPLPLPELVIVPVLLTPVPERVIPSFVVLLLSRTRLAVPILVTPPDTDNVPAVSVNVVPPEFTARPPVMFSAEPPVLFSVIPVTFEPTPPPDIVVVLIAVPMFVITPALLTAYPPAEVPEKPMPLPLLPFSSIVKSLLPVTPPLKVVTALPRFMIFRVPVVTPDPNTIALVYDSSAFDPSRTCSIAELLLLELLPNVTAPEPKEPL